MKLTIGDYEVDINARYTPLRNKMSQHDTKAFLLMMAMWAWDAAENNTLNGYHALANEAMEAADTIHDTLVAAGYLGGK